MTTSNTANIFNATTAQNISGFINLSGTGTTLSHMNKYNDHSLHIENIGLYNDDVKERLYKMVDAIIDGKILSDIQYNTLISYGILVDGKTLERKLKLGEMIKD